MAGGSCIGGGQPCPCISYEEEATDDGHRCYECHHGKSRHCGTTASDVDNPNPLVSNNGLGHNLGSVPDTSLLSRGSIGSGLTRNSLTLLHELVHQPKGSTLSTFGKPVSKDEARAEALQGFRPKPEVRSSHLTITEVIYTDY